jgi:aspartate/methionine/tyrosine aminotransferase
MTMETGFRFDLDRLRALITPRTRMVVLNSPSNPTGGVLGRRELEAVAELALAHNLLVLSDEIYSSIVYDGWFDSIASIPGMAARTILIDGFSKTYAMTGWRLGYAVLPRTLAPAIGQLVLNTLSSTTTFIQPAGVEALTGPQTEAAAMVDMFRRRRDRMVAQLNVLPGVECLAPAGAFYAFPRVSGTGLSSAALSQHILDEVGVVTYPGTTFGDRGEGFLRLSFACSENDIDEGLRRIGAVLSKL